VAKFNGNDFLSHFRKRDPVIARAIERVGPCTLKPRRDRFGMLVRSIISQQISTSAARSILARVTALMGEGGIRAETLRSLSADQLRTAGVSPQKVGYLHDLAEKVASGAVRLDRIGRLPDEQVIEQLTQVKGVGRWTAQMFLIFSLGRPDVFPHDDLGVRSAIKRLYGLDELPDKQTSLAIGARWSPYASVASWYCWRVLELEPKSNGKAKPNAAPQAK
jgi:DNA-3-methyladenine glycosylase II